ncbi:MAG: bifunctional 5,10-methylenetetrahydrofolate dehydrogenase/5,10-methenyltetrahydrofolate cyclohydrolase [Candidatus Sungbacteria bacterium]|uniref:Bifunctional protein FolD n=1 Tax=Candidatus Sungiibacteriota bacterium TaxID=2750080 RepID=A0A931WPL6_9BACT|nr:bifunctional 5,10-methylenetetrahydrofolate dehydrogenase/5,10-methenyltetrahydrofolate cyclohydrolase [Candidatus Sungbacteria bacterium]
MNLFDGKQLAGQVLKEARELMGAKKLSLGIVVAGDDPATRAFVAQKEKRGAELGVDVRVYEESVSQTSRKLRRRIAELVKKTKHDGWVVQLPLPEGMNTQYVLNAIPEVKDVDVLNQKSVGAFVAGRAKVLPPVVGAVKTLLESQNISLANKKIVLVGTGRLVGRPVALWLISQDLPFSSLTFQSPNLSILKEADIIISGAGQPGLIHGEIVKDGAVVIDAGTSELSEKLVGDVDQASFESKDGWLSPVPGGVGPLTVAYIFKNLAVLAL